VLALAMVFSMIGAISYLAASTRDSIFSGPTFFVFLWGLALLALFALVQAALAILARDFRSHMVWMAIAFAEFLTAPFLRLDWVLLGTVLPMSLQRANAAIGTVVLVQTVLLIQLWLGFVGDADLPANTQMSAAASRSRWPRWLLQNFAAWSAIAVLHEGVLAPLGWGIGSLRDTSTVLPLAALPWAAGAVLAALWSMEAWDKCMQGDRLPPRFFAAATLSCVGAVWMAAHIARTSLDGETWAFYWIAMGVMQQMVLLFAWVVKPNSIGRNAWGITTLFMLWAPALMLPIAVLLSFTALTANEVQIGASTLAIGGMVSAGAVTGMGVSLRSQPTSRKRATVA
jgi:hypothetical protein